ncbi:hypothetical protein CXT94_05165 [Akkermansia muciniphila]|nr:hypothetical protein CXT94_05165 [Akkermansia muciniphila]
MISGGNEAGDPLPVMPVRRLRGKPWGAGLLGLPGSVSFPAAHFMARGGWKWGIKDGRLLD